MKKIVMAAVVLMEMFVFAACSESDGDIFSEDFPSAVSESISPSETAAEEFAENLSYIDEKLRAVISGDNYQNGSTDSRVQLLKPVLEQLLDEGYLAEYQFDLEGNRPNVSFKYAGGGGGSVMLNEFPKDQN